MSAVSLAEPAGVVSVDRPRLYACDFQADFWQSWAIGWLEASLASPPPCSHHGRPEKRTLWGPIMIHGKCAELG